MQEVFDRRCQNLRQLAQQRGGTTALAEELGLTKGRLSQLIGRRPSASISEKLARSFEETLSLAPKYLDQITSDLGIATPPETSDNIQPSRTSASENLKQNLTRILTEHAISQSELARRAGMHPKSINRLVSPNDQTPSPTLDTLQALASGLNTSVGALLSKDFSIPNAVIGEFTPTPRLASAIARLVEDFILCSPEERAALIAAAMAAAERSCSRST